MIEFSLRSKLPTSPLYGYHISVVLFSCFKKFKCLVMFWLRYPWKLKVWSTVKIPGTRVPQKAIVPVGRPRPYSIIILNMRFIPKASLRASSQITASSYILERHLWVNNSKLFALAPTWSLAYKQTDCITAGMLKMLDPKFVYWHPVNTKHLYDFMQCWTNVEDAEPTLYKCYTNVLARQEDFLSNIVHLFNVGSMLGRRRRRWPSIKTTLDQCPV